MLEFSWYLLEASLVLSVLYALYALLLRGETFFGFNRFFLLAIVMISLLAPLLSWDFVPEKEVVVRRPIEQVRNMRQGYFEALGDWYFEAASSEQESERQVHTPIIQQWNWKAISIYSLFTIYLLGVMAVWSRLGWMLYGLYALRKKFPSREVNHVRVVELPDRSAPFSFLQTVFVNKEVIGTPAFYQIMAHEQVHIRQRHSIDLITVQILAAGLWFHPLVWRLLKSLKTTHEYIADKQMISSGHSLVEYQSLLLSQLISNQSYGLVHNFNLSFIKKRITMMKIKQSGWGGRAKVAVTLSLAVIVSITLMQ
ncbi:M56 family metallopeptidase [Reichenbachiella ulvae]|uniref:Peptidase M56 domain-containing protein n=1 Tax=Reichenbachiella ulvae TaxID=2980104 RepID=A0ABT3CVS9_9BACT|nr:M56 family metallopeptidase [Reichenbachiella ulvae]MCV9387805.1 hypothetical protein [Reichenbachiella ulvae]